MKKLFQKNREKGMTLIEVVISLAILSILLLFLGMTFETGLNILCQSAKKTIKSNHAAGGVEQYTANGTNTMTDANVNNTAGNFTIVFGAFSVTVGGNYLSGSDTGNNVTYKSFVPDK